MEKEVDNFLQENRTKEFSVNEFREHRLLPWALNYRTLTRLVKSDFFGENVLKARIEGEGNGARYFIKGENIINYKKKYGTVMMLRVRKPKQKYANKNKRSKSGDRAIRS